MSFNDVFSVTNIGDNLMKVAFHFDADYFEINYGDPIEKAFFSKLLSYKPLLISSKVFIGDLLAHSYAYDEQETKNGCVKTFNKDKYIKILEAWANPENHVWLDFPEEYLIACANRNVFVICLESIEFKLAKYLSKSFREFEYYLGAMEVDDLSPVHWMLYSNSLIPCYRIINANINVFWDGINEDEKNENELKELQKLGFKKIKHESLEGKFAIFDKYANFEHAKRITEWKREFGNLLTFLVDHMVCRLSDIAPEVGNKLWAAMKTFEDAETNEQHAQVATSCRRILEYIVDSIFPPSEKEVKGHKLDKKKFKNRLLAFADQERKSNTNIDLICTSTSALEEQIDKLLNLQNKGVHGEIFRAEARRCLLRTVLLLDDIISLKQEAFEIKDHIDMQMISDMIMGDKD